MRDMYDIKKPMYEDECDRMKPPRKPDRMEPPRKPDRSKKPDQPMQPEPEVRLATAYIPNQPYVGLVSLQEGFHRGSMFPNLYQPYHDWRRH